MKILVGDVGGTKTLLALFIKIGETFHLERQEKFLSREHEDLAVTWFSSIYGAEAGNLALKGLSLGGIFIGGGIAPSILPTLKEGAFMEGFLEKGRFSSLLKNISVKVLLKEETTLQGALFFLKKYFFSK
jgi:glucokinase